MPAAFTWAVAWVAIWAPVVAFLLMSDGRPFLEAYGQSLMALPVWAFLGAMGPANRHRLFGFLLVLPVLLVRFFSYDPGPDTDVVVHYHED